MTRKDLLNACRYYKGTKICPYEDQNKHALWMYERAWVYDTLQAIESRTISNTMGDTLATYISVGLAGFKNMDGVSISLKAYIFDRYAKTAQTPYDAVEPFKKFYETYY